MAKKSKNNKNLQENNQPTETFQEQQTNQLELIEESIIDDKIEFVDQENTTLLPEKEDSKQDKPTFGIVFAKGGNTLIFISIIFLIMTGLINFRNFFNQYETIILNEIKDLLFWARFTLSNFLIVSFILFIFGIDFNKAIKEENKFVMMLVLILFILTGISGYKIYLV